MLGSTTEDLGTILTPTVNGVQGAPGQAYFAPLSVPQETVVRYHQRIWATQREFAVVAAQGYTLAIKAYRYQGTAAYTDCSGNLAVRIHTATLP